MHQTVSSRTSVVELLEDRRLLAGHITKFEVGKHAIGNGAVIDIAHIANHKLVITAVTAGTVKSMKFSGEEPRTDNSKAFQTERTFAPGEHTLTATYFKRIHASGKIGSKHLAFTVIDSRIAPKINSVAVIDESTGTLLVTLHDGDTLDPSTLIGGKLGVEAFANIETRKVSFSLDGESEGSDSAAPFTKGDLITDLLTPGDHTLVFKPHGVNGKTGKSVTIHVTTGGTPVPTGPEVSSLSLVRADNQALIRDLVQNDTISLSELPTSGAFIRANITGTVGLVQFHLDLSNSIELDTSAPYETGGPGSDEFVVGAHKLTIKAFSGFSNGSGGGDPFIFNYTIGVPEPV